MGELWDDAPIPDPYGVRRSRERFARRADADAALMERVRVEREARQVAAKVEIIDSFGDDPYADGDVVKFTKTFGVKEYMYAALKVNELWYLTGPTQRDPYAWEDFLLWLVAGTPVTELTKLIPESVPESAPAPTPMTAADVSTIRARGPAPAPLNLPEHASDRDRDHWGNI